MLPYYVYKDTTNYYFSKIMYTLLYVILFCDVIMLIANAILLLIDSLNEVRIRKFAGKIRTTISIKYKHKTPCHPRKVARSFVSFVSLF